jgi:uncharacterized glyoxalase superfamily protein PhnB
MTATFYPSMRFRDADAAIAFLERAFGFEAGDVHRGDDGRVRHGELWLQGAAIMLGEGESPAPQSTYAAIDDVDALHERARSAGAEIVRELEETPYGSREFSARDPEGNTWHFGTYRAAQP